MQVLRIRTWRLWPGLGQVQRLLRRVVLSSLLLGLLASASVFMYVTFHLSFVPSPQHVREMRMNFDMCPEKRDRCSFIKAHAHLDVDEEHDQDGRSDERGLRSSKPLLMSGLGQSYRLSLSLDLPESPSNRRLGMFMCCLRLIGMSGRPRSGSICKSAMLEYRSELLRILETFVFAPFLLSGQLAQKQKIEVEMLKSFVDDPIDPLAAVEVDIESKHLQVYSMQLLIQASFTGLKHAMFNHPYISFVMGSTFNFMVLATLALVSWVRFGYDKEEDDDDSEDEDELERDVRRERRRLREEVEDLGHDENNDGNKQEDYETSSDEVVKEKDMEKLKEQ